MNDVSGGLAAVSVGLPAWLLLIVLGVAVLGAWKLSKLLWATLK